MIRGLGEPGRTSRAQVIIRAAARWIGEKRPKQERRWPAAWHYRSGDFPRQTFVSMPRRSGRLLPIIVLVVNVPLVYGLFERLEFSVLVGASGGVPNSAIRSSARS